MTAVNVRAGREVSWDYSHVPRAQPQPAPEIKGGNFKSIKGPTHTENHLIHRLKDTC